MAETCTMKWFEEHAIGMIRIQSGAVVFERVFEEHPDISPDLRRKAVTLASLPSMPRLLFVEAALTPSLTAQIRFLNNVALIVVTLPERVLETREQLQGLTEDDILHLGGGLSNYGDVFNTFEMARVDGDPDRCTSKMAVDFLNDSFDFLFARESKQLRLAYCRNFAKRFAFLRVDGNDLSTVRDYPLNEAEREELTLKFNRMVEALEMTTFASFENSPIAAPPWKKKPPPHVARGRLDDNMEVY